MLSRITWIISKAVFTLIDCFLNSPKVINLFGPLLRVNLLPRNRPIWSHWMCAKCVEFHFAHSGIESCSTLPANAALSLDYIGSSFSKNGPFPASFSLFVFVFSILLTVNNVQSKLCWWRDSNRGLVVSKATALSTYPQLLLHCNSSYHSICVFGDN